MLALTSLPFNSTITETNFLMSNTTIPSETINAYDHQGAAVYIAVILIWYSTGLAMMLFLQVRPRSLQHQFLFESSDSSTKKRLQKLTTNPFKSYQNIQADNATKQILNELKDPERRQRLWKIYYASSDKQNEPYPQYYQTISTDSATIDRIKRKLADIHRMDLNNDDDFVSLSNMNSTNNNNRPAISAFDSTKFFSKRFPSLRRPTNGSSATTTTNNRPLFTRFQSQTDTPTTNTVVEMEPLVNRKQSLASSTNVSRKRNNLFSNRFTIEKVSDNNNTKPFIVNENSSG